MLKILLLQDLMKIALWPELTTYDNLQFILRFFNLKIVFKNPKHKPR